jgi:Uma2 family endonuclease
MEMPPLQTRPWTRAEYERLIATGVLDEGEPIELLGGQIAMREPQCSRHATGVRLAEEALRRAFGCGWDVRAGLPVALDEESEPEPDVCVVPGGPRTYRHAHPSRPALVVEVALTSLAVDRHIKGSLYARAGIRDYWIVNLPASRVEVYRRPTADADAAYDWRYVDVTVLRPEDLVAPLATLASAIAVADLLP